MVYVRIAKASWFSLPHGIDPRVSKLARRTREGPQGVGITIYASSVAEARHYDELYGLPRSQVKVVGVPRHDQRWIRRLREHYRGQPGEKGKYIFLASRPVNEQNFPPVQKIEALQALKTLADQLDCRVLVRLHPLETGFDKDIIESVFGKDVLGKTWSYSTLPPMVAAEGALFAVTLFSSVAIDMLAIDVPVIELCDFADLTELPNLVHDIDGRLTSIYQQSGLVLGAANFEQLNLVRRPNPERTRCGPGKAQSCLQPNLRKPRSLRGAYRPGHSRGPQPTNKQPEPKR